MNIPVFCCDCGLTDQEVMDDLASVVRLTGFETDTELQRLHLEVFHNEDDRLFWDDTDFYGTEGETITQLHKEHKIKVANYGMEKCAYCPPYKNDNASRTLKQNSKAKHGVQKKTKVNKKQGHIVKRLMYDENQRMDSVRVSINKAGKRK